MKTVARRNRPVKQQPPRPAAEACPAEPIVPCEVCGKRVWCYHDFEDGTDIYYCPDHTTFGLPPAA